MSITAILCFGLLLTVAADRGDVQTPAEDAVRRIVEEVFEQASVVEMEESVEILYVPTEWTLKKLRNLGDSAIPHIARYLKSQDVRQRQLSVALLGNQGGIGIIPHLKEALGDKEARVRLAAVAAISVLPPGKASALWEKVLTRDPDNAVRASAQRFLEKQKE